MTEARANSFGSAADAYARARPSYPAEAVRWVLPERAATVLDLGAGTGRVTSVLLGLGMHVVAVEPDPQMRAHIDDRALVLAGSAEEIPLEDDSVDAVLVGQAWHWFDSDRAAAQCRRVLRPGGRLGLLWNVLDDRVGWVARLADLVGLEDRLSAAEADDPPLPVWPGSSWERRLLPHGRQGGPDLVLDDLRSRSQVITLPTDARKALLGQARTIIPADVTETAYICDVWRSTAP